MNDTLDELQRKAEAATPGPWHVGDDDRPGMSWNRHIMSSPHAAVCFMAHSDGKDPERDEATAAHIAAADPQTVLRLIAVARAAQKISGLKPHDRNRLNSTAGKWVTLNVPGETWNALRKSLAALAREEGTR